MILGRLSIEKKIYLIPLLAILCFSAYLVISAMSASSNAARLTQARDVEFPLLRISDKVYYSLERVKELMQSAATTADVEPLNNAKQITQALLENLRQAQAIAAGSHGELEQIHAQINTYFQTSLPITESMIDGTADFSSLQQKTIEMNAQYETAIASIEAFQQNQLKEFEGKFATAEEAASRLVTHGFILGAVMIIVILSLAIPVTAGIKRNLLRVVSSLKAISNENGDLTVRLRSRGSDEIADLVHWFNLFVEKLQTVIGDVVRGVAPLSSIAEELSNASQSAQSSIDFQRESTSRAQQAVGEVNNSVSDIANSARQAAQAASQANETASEGRAIVNQTVDSIQSLAANISNVRDVIHRLEQDSEKVGSVLDVIKSIAEQTNLLALNAAIEAARAGEQGRGFAVVADEVRTLASRTQESTLEIQETITNLQQVAKSAVSVMKQSNEQASVSVERATAAGESLKAIDSSIGNINQMNETIASATEAQARVVNEIVAIINEIHQRSEQTSDQSLRLGKVSSDLLGLSQQMSAVSQKFKV